ncbi:MAG: aminoglycoside phosphotransferase family protein [Caldilineaceae bacterium]
MNELQAQAAVQQIVAGITRTARQINFVDQGSTSAVWRVETDQDALAVRLATPHDGKSARFEGEAGLRVQLFARDSRVAQPIASNVTHPELVAPEIEWCVDSFVAGETLIRGALPKNVCHDLGELLAKLHTLPAEGYGLLVNRRDTIRGRADNVIDGLCTRLQDPWPFRPMNLREHPIAQAAPHLLPRIEPYRDDLLSLLDEEPGVPLHTDLHERQMPCVDGRLNGLLDFGDAMVGPVVGDIGSFMGFHGKAQTQWMLEGYTADRVRRNELLAQAQLWSIVTSLHHASRAVTLNSAGRMSRVIQFLEENL